MIIANVMAPYVAWGIGEEDFLSLPFSMLATTFAAAVERPFYSAAGIKHSSFRLAMQANIFSWFIGLVIAYVSLFNNLMMFFMLIYFLAIPFSILLEREYLRFVTRGHGLTELRWGPIIAGNVISGALLFAILVFGQEIGIHLWRNGSSLLWFLIDHQNSMYLGVLIACLLFFLVCFLLRRASGQTSVETASFQDQSS